MDTETIDITHPSLPDTLRMVAPADVDLLWRDYPENGCHEPKTTELLAALLRQQPNAVFWDVGSFYGYFAVVANSLLSNPSNVTVFEPVAEHRSIIAANNRRYANGAFTLVDKALGDTATTGVTTGDLYCRRTIPPTTVKIDVEGDECAVLSGMSETLSRFQPNILLEVHVGDGYAVDTETLSSRLPYSGYEYLYCPAHRSVNGTWHRLDEPAELPATNARQSDYLLAGIATQTDTPSVLDV